MDRKLNPDEFGKYTYGYDSLIVKDFGTGERLKIGNFCSLSSGITILLGGNHPIQNVSTYPFGVLNTNIFSGFINIEKRIKDTVIGNDVWIGHGVTILTGITIGDGSVISANSNVVKDVEPYSIVGGNPAKFIKKRFTEDQINKLLEIKWWDLEDSKIRELLPHICSDDIDQFIKLFNK
jgi:acetyltransferase-like isoleucine patch superfamily enzyme